MGNKSSKKKQDGVSGETRNNRKRTSFKESLRSLTGREKKDRDPPEIPEDKGPRIQLEVPVENYSFPFENVVFEGGGNKALAYCGAVRALEELGIWKRVRRVAGTSSGALAAAMLSVGYNSYQLERYLSQDLRDMFTDHCCGCCSFLHNNRTKFGWNPAKRFHKWFGEKIKDATGKADITFIEVYEKFERELCIPVTNVSQKSIEYCHPKTTPDMPIRLAVKMSVTMPGLIQPVKYRMNDVSDYYIDGGLLCNYPLHCFDGWWLSMRTRDSFLERLSPLAQLPKCMDQDNRFGTYNERTLGFIVYSDQQDDVYSAVLQDRSNVKDSSELPDSTLAKKRKEAKENRKYSSDKHTDLAMALKNFLKALKDHGLDDSKSLSRNDLQNILSKRTELSDIDVRILFGKNADAETVFSELNITKKDQQLVLVDLVRYIDRRGLRYLCHYNNYRRTDITTLGNYLFSLQQTFLEHSGRSQIKKRDLDRCVGINTGHVGTVDYNLQRQDRQYLVEQGKKGTKDFLEYYILQKLPPSSGEDNDGYCADDLGSYIDDELSEIIDTRDYLEDFSKLQ